MREPVNNRAKFIAAIEELGLTVIAYSSDGWPRAMKRNDGLHLWPIASSRLGCGIQTAWLMDGKYAHRQHYTKHGTFDMVEDLKEANQRKALNDQD